MPHVFDRFYQVDASAARKNEGTGIGLAHSLELVKLMNGQINVESEPGNGTVFTVMLPIVKGDAPTVLADKNEKAVCPVAKCG
ncbi:MAG: ATP-binding protein [Saprospiraceae bacterium]